ncbi:predicted protein, partial [Haematococcus lacustris]
MPAQASANTSQLLTVGCSSVAWQDQDGSGAIDADELGAAFKLLGIHMKKAELGELLNEVDHDGSGVPGVPGDHDHHAAAPS